MDKPINIIGLISLLLTAMSLPANAQNEVDPIYETMNEGLNIYKESGDVDRLLAIGPSLPESIYVINSSRTGHVDYDFIRPIRTELYVRWLSEFLMLVKELELDYDPISFDLNDPRNRCGKTSNAIVINPTPKYLEQVELYKKNCEIRYYHMKYQSTMELFNCFYKRAFSKQGKRLTDLLSITKDWCEKNIDDPALQADILEIVRRKARNNRCTRL
ncbi:MAG: hypothetical protein ACRBG0_27060 [Lewinella sp.]|uniref:hypothetical protein n=1 Tax=Lewinella sp. TaxID=2004506 RepID=UPI003D6B2DC8